MGIQYRADSGLCDEPVAHGNGPNGGALPVSDANSIAIAITPTNTVPTAPILALGHRIAVVCTVAGNVKFGFMDGSVLTVPVAVGLTLLPFRVAQIFVTGTTATATYAGLK